MALSLASPRLSRFPHPSYRLCNTNANPISSNPPPSSPLFFLLLVSDSRTLCFSNHLSISVGFRSFRAQASSSRDQNGAAEAPSSSSGLLDGDDMLCRVSSAKDAAEALQMIAESSDRSGGVVPASDCCSIISAALRRNNADLALSIFYAMRSTFDEGVSSNNTALEIWKWSRPDVHIYTSLVRGLAASLRVSDALRMISDVCRVGVSPSEEVPFGKLVRCPSCLIAVAVAQPQHGIQVVSCSQCRYQYELVSGDIACIESEEISMDAPAWRRGLRFLEILKQNIPVAVHSIVIQTPSGRARTHKFATKTVDLPAQEGERVTIALAAPSNVYREVGPLKFSPRATNFYPGEPICLTSHRNGKESQLLRAPFRDGNQSLINPSILFPLLAVVATGEAATRIIDANLPQVISVAAFVYLALGATINTMVLPELNRFPQRTADAIAVKQKLLSQYDILQSRIRDLKEAAEKEVWMLARLFQLENKIVVVGEPSYRARRSRVKKVKESLEISLTGRIELIESYARISSMIEIEVEMDSDVLAAEAENISEQIQQIMELESLKENWRIQAEANDEVERMLSSQPITTPQV